MKLTDLTLDPRFTVEELIYLPRKFEALNGLVLTKIELSDSELHFHTRCGHHFVSYHEQDCCESVWLESYDGNLLDLLNSQLTMAEKSVVKTSVDLESQTATFYKLSTNKGSCTFTWRGGSNGYYSESVDFAEIVKEKDV